VANLFSILVLAQLSADNDVLLESLLKRYDLDLIRVTTTNAARVALHDVAVSVVIVCPETPATAVTSILDAIGHLGLKTPVIVLRIAGTELSADWKRRTFAILRCPILPRVLSRTLDIALGLGRLPR